MVDADGVNGVERGCGEGYELLLGLPPLFLQCISSRSKAVGESRLGDPPNTPMMYAIGVCTEFSPPVFTRVLHDAKGSIRVNYVGP